MPDILENLTDAQREAVTHLDGPMLVVAGAGSGKTRVVTHRIAYLIQRGVWPNQVLAMTFTNKAAREMVERVQALIGERPPWVGTFHSACARFLRRDLEKLNDGRTNQFTIYDEDDQLSVIKVCMKECGLSQHDMGPGAVRAAISRAKAAMAAPDAMARDADDYTARVVPVYRAYEKRLRDLNAVDFDDLLLLVVRLLQDNPALRDVYHNRFRYLLVDEYQDTNHLQYLLMRLLAGPARNVHVTGDPDQSIYSWRGAEYRNIMEFQTDFPDAKLVRLEQNYRSTKLILRAANELIRRNTQRIDKELFTENERGVPARVVRLRTDRDEAAWVVDQVLALHADGVRLRQMAVFYRTNAQSRPLEERLLAAGVPYQIIGGIRFYQRKEIKDLVAHLQILTNPRDEVALQRVAACRKEGVGPRTLAAVTAQARADGMAVMDLVGAPDFQQRYRGRCSASLAQFAQWCRGLLAIPRAPVGACVKEVLEYSGLAALYGEGNLRDPQAEDRVQNLESMVSRAMEYQRTHPDACVEALLEEIALVSDIDAHDPESDSLALMTLHSAKGLEFPHVFIVGVEEGYLPHFNTLEDFAAVEEERRLLYVGITRAQRGVCLSCVMFRYLWDGLRPREPSRFLTELPNRDVKYVNWNPRRR